MDADALQAKVDAVTAYVDAFEARAEAAGWTDPRWSVYIADLRRALAAGDDA